MTLKNLFIAGALPAMFLVSSAANAAGSSTKQVEDLRGQFFMPAATNALCPQEQRVSTEKFEAFRSSVLTYLDYLHASAEQEARPQFEKARAEIAGADIPAPFLDQATKIYRSYSPAEAEFFFCAKLNRMFDLTTDIVNMTMAEEQKRRGKAGAN